MAITTAELARRLCVRNHPHLKTTGQIVPCGEHLRQGNLYWALATVPYTHTFEVIRDAREEFLDEGEHAEPSNVLVRIDGLRELARKAGYGADAAESVVRALVEQTKVAVQ